MNKLNLKNLSLTAIFTLGLVANATTLFAQETSISNPSQELPIVEECTKELLLAYFPANYVTVTLKKFNVPEEKWKAITSELTIKDKTVLKMVEDKAAKLNPNPFKDRDPAQRQVAVKLFRDTLFQVFSDVLKNQGVNDDKQIQSMLDDVQQQKAQNFKHCMEQHKTTINDTDQDNSHSTTNQESNSKDTSKSNNAVDWNATNKN